MSRLPTLHRRPPLSLLTAALLLLLAWPRPGVAAEPLPPPEPPAGRGDGDLQIEVTKKGLGKEVVIKQGAKEWFMMIEVTAENTVIVRQELDNGTYLVDESETHDRAMSAGEVDAAIEAFINGVKSRVTKRK
ncbi:hypothetical protein [Nitrospira sp. Kam-Ns4a]